MSTFTYSSQPQTTPDLSTTLPNHSDAADDDPDAAGSKKKKVAKRRKVNHACLYCRRSHMTCDEGRPCQRCIKREIGHLCHDERRSKTGDKAATTPPTANNLATTPAPAPPNPAWPMSVGQSAPFMYRPETLGNEFSVLTDFLETLDESSFFTPPPAAPILHSPFPQSQSQPAMSTVSDGTSSTTTDESGSRDERLNRVIRSKYEAGLLKPYNYVKGYARLSRWMDRNVSQESKQQILQPLSVLRPKFRAVAQSLRDIDLVFIEEAFERLLLDYDRVFSAMGVPACLWRRTGEIYKGNREFSELVGVDGYMMRDGRLCIYELMAEESAVNYWEKYGHVAFDSSQKAVLTSCVLRYKPNLNSTAPNPNSNSAATNGSSNGIGNGVKKEEEIGRSEEGLVNCCFSFTIRRDKWGIPSMIVGNFIKC
ncbi:hypothetical protein EDD18DRAFT_1345813 [Armillaria luteobubalina]|uniref:Zn(2)-C6 fungal-type domain-containing protein n=1 Tax=Armillaria luteobubalina TaxID=153913 RepID=A0AA39QHD8_9AGAR|nr:hypothetical protein EDD18DRAFT_1345813 [Armillaria luteobubalina]